MISSCFVSLCSLPQNRRITPGPQNWLEIKPRHTSVTKMFMKVVKVYSLTLCTPETVANMGSFHKIALHVYTCIKCTTASFLFLLVCLFVFFRSTLSVLPNGHTCSSSSGTDPTRPLQTVLGVSSPTSTEKNEAMTQHLASWSSYKLLVVSGNSRL